MSLPARQPIRQCGKRYGTKDEAEAAALRLSARTSRPGIFAPEPCWAGCEGYHVRYRKAASEHPERKPPKSDGLTRTVRHLVLARDGYACACCGRSIIGQPYSLQDRKRRSQGGRRVPSNLVTVLGTGTTACHERIDSRRDPRDEDRGLTVRSHQDPRMVPVEYHLPDGSRRTRWLADDGGLLDEAPEEAA